MKERWKQLLIIAWPLVIANSFWNLQLTIDRIFLGNYSTAALGAAMAVMGVFWVPMALLQQTSSYITTFVAQYYGSKNYEKIGASFWQSMYVSVIGGFLFLLLIFLSPPLFKWIDHAINLQELEIEYFNSLAWSALPMALTAAISGFFTGLGKTRVVIGINFVGLLANVVFDYLLIFGNFNFPALGITGAGYATAMASFVSAFYGGYRIYKSSYFSEYGLSSQWQFNKKLIQRFLKFGIPSGLQWAFEGLAFTTFLIIIGNLKNGSAALAGSSISVTLMMLSVLPAMGVAQAVMTLVGQKLGENDPEKARLYTWDGVKISSIYMMSVALSLWLFPDIYLSLFKGKDDPFLWQQVLEITPVLLKIVAIFTVFDAIYLNISFALKGAGDTRFVSLLALTVPWPLMVLPTFLFKEQVNAVFYAWGFAAVYVIITAIIIALRFRGGKWMNMRVT